MGSCLPTEWPPITGLTNTGSHQFFSAREQASLTLTRVGNTLILNFFGTLQESDSVKGPYKDMTVTSPYTAAIGTAQQISIAPDPIKNANDALPERKTVLPGNRLPIEAVLKRLKQVFEWLQPLP